MISNHASTVAEAVVVARPSRSLRCQALDLGCQAQPTGMCQWAEPYQHHEVGSLSNPLAAKTSQVVALRLEDDFEMGRAVDGNPSNLDAEEEEG